MTQLSPQTGAAAATKTEEAVHMYPDNQLRQQRRGFDDTLSAFDVVKAALAN